MLLCITTGLTSCIHAATADELAPPGVIIDHLPQSTDLYVGSPAIAVLPNGDYVASHDLFGPHSTDDITRVFGSPDKGATWELLTEIKGQEWSSLFVHRGELYLMGTSAEYGHCVIRRSADGGKTWTFPSGPDSGLLFADGPYHSAPVPVLIHDGRIWRGMEDAQGPGNWGSHFRTFMMSASLDADLLKASSWTSTNRLGRDPAWLDGKFGGWLEGNVVATLDGDILNILRVDYHPEGGKAAVVKVSTDGKTASFDPATGFIDFPGGCKKFTIRYDTVSERYWSLTNYICPRDKGGNPERTRNTLALTTSEDLRHWSLRSIVLYHPDVKRTGFQYVDWLFEVDDIIAVCRTAHDDGVGGAHNCHDANYMTFHRIRKFRERTLEEPPRSA
ncbi:MAG: exo-alpha-sialidase [Nitrospiraceae bacterium]|nr:exo-alpha-sialidase [Nitrospiraceae bacterium]